MKNYIQNKNAMTLDLPVVKNKRDLAKSTRVTQSSLPSNRISIESGMTSHFSINDDYTDT